jgi:hypothetical protein
MARLKVLRTFAVLVELKLVNWTSTGLQPMNLDRILKGTG